MNVLTAGLVCVAAIVAVAHGHLCLVNPQQRGSMTGLDKAGAADCALTVPPCGLRKRENPKYFLKNGETYTFTVQKNLNHFNSKAPGKFTFSLAKFLNELDFKQIASFPDTNAPSLTYLLFNVTMPKDINGLLVLQAAYITNNPKAPQAFYQCADLTLNPK